MDGHAKERQRWNIPDMISQKADRIPYINFPNNTAKWCSGCLVLPVLSSPEATRSEKGRAVTAETQFSDMHVPTPLEDGPWGRYCSGILHGNAQTGY